MRLSDRKEPTVPIQPAFHGLTLRRIFRDDLPILLQWRNEEKFRNECSSMRELITDQEFQQELERQFAIDRHEQVILIAANGTAIGTLFSYDYSRSDGHLFVSAYLDEKVRNRGFGVYALLVFSRWLFDGLRLFKIYADVYTTNSRVIAQLRRAGASEEGRFKGHRKCNGLRVDVIRFAVYQEQLTSALMRFMSDNRTNAT